MLVVATHAGYLQDHEMGPQAVDMFFVLSAFLLTLLFEKKVWKLFYNGVFQWSVRMEHSSPWPHYTTFFCVSLAMIYCRLDELITSQNVTFMTGQIVFLRGIECFFLVLFLVDSIRMTPRAATATPKQHDGTNAQGTVAVAQPQPEPEPSAAAAVAPLAARPSDRKDSILFLDGMRGLAAMLVVLTHAGYMKDRKLGPAAVDTFFVLSAFLLTLIFEAKARELFSEKASYGRWALALTDYLVRRFLRVYPLFAIVAVVLALLPPEERVRSLHNKHTADYNLLDVLSFQSHPYVLWTLPIEISYYFLIPVFVLAELKMGRLWWLLGLAGYALVFYNGLYQWEARRGHDSPWPHYPTFLCGSLAAVVYSRINRLVAKHKFKFKPWLAATLQTCELLVVVLLLSQLFGGLVFDWIGPNPLPDSNHFVSFPLTLLIVGEMLHRGFFAAVLEWSLLRFAGKISYSMYLLHIFVVHQPVVVHQKYYYDKYFMIWILVFLLSTASYYIVEWPGQRLASLFSNWIKRQDAMLRAVSTVKKRNEGTETEETHARRKEGSEQTNVC